MKPGIVCNVSPQPQRTLPLSALGAATLYAALCGALCDMAALGTLGLWPLAPGLAFCALLALLPHGKRWTLSALAVLVLALCASILLRLRVVLDGAALYANRLFAASEARQAYAYEKFSVTASPDAIRAFLLPSGLVLGALCGVAARWRQRWIDALLFLLPAALAAYLGVTPQWFWLAALCAALVVCFAATVRGAAGGVLALCLLTALVLLAVPGEDARLSAWEETARDALALHTVAYGQTPQVEEVSPPTQIETAAQRFHEEEIAADTGGDETPLHRPPAALWAILAFALALFIPAVLSDRLKKRRARNRAAMADEDAAKAVRAGFLYAMRWLRLGGLPDGNRPFSAYADSVPSALREDYEAVLPLWQEAAYSGHVMTPAQRTQMGAFAEKTREAVWSGLNKRSRFVAKYILAL